MARARLAAACCAAAAALALSAAPAGAQRERPGLPLVPLPDGPLVIETAEARIRLVTVTRDLSHPWALAFLPDGRMLVTERAGRLRVIRDGVLDPQPIAGVPPVHATAVAGLMDVALHPRFAENRLVYLTYSQPADDGARVTLARGRLDGAALAGVETLFESEPLISNDGAGASRIVFAPDGTIYVTVGGAFEDWAMRAQDPGDTAGKLLRLRDDGSVPDDNPFVGREGYRPEIYSLGHRNQLGMAIHPETGDLWAHENGPLGGDELNIIRAGANYGWPVVSYSRQYSGPRVAARPVAGGDGAVRDRLAAVRGAVRDGVLRRRPLPAVGREPVRGGPAHRRRPQHRPPGAHRLQRERRRAAARVDSDGAAPADPRRAPGAGRPAVRADRRRGSRAVQNRTCRVGINAASAQSGAAAEREVTFAKDIAPILQRSCQECHRPLGDPASVAPMSLLTDEEFEREMAERRERLQLSKNDYVIGCPPCLAEFPSAVQHAPANADNDDQQ